MIVFIQRASLTISTFALAGFVAMPILVVAAYIVFGSYDVWSHLFESVLQDYVVNSLVLVLGVSIGVLLIGVSTACLVSLYEFPGRVFFSWALLLPLAMPAYIIAYTYTGVLDFAGPVQTWLRALTGWQYGTYWFFEIRSLPGAIIMLILVLYPYVYLLTRTAFMEQSASIIELAQTMGNSRSQSILRVALPLARPAIVAGLSLALMETLADYGTMQYFGVTTFTTGIFRAFFGFGDSAAAAQLSGMLLVFVAALLFLERYSRRRARYFQNKGKLVRRHVLQGNAKFFSLAICVLPLVLGFVIPVAVLTYWTFTEALVGDGFLQLVWNSFYLAFCAASITVFAGLLLAYAKRCSRSTLHNTAISVAGMGYALPGTIVAVGVLIPLSRIDHVLIHTLNDYFGIEIGLFFSGSILALLFAYMVRFLTISLGGLDSALQKASPNVDRAAGLLGERPLGVLSKIHFPLLKGPLLTVFLLVFVDVLKELPATLILRPFDFNTLAVRAYELASDERLSDAAPASLLIVLVGLVPVLLLSRSINQSQTFLQQK